MAMGWLARPFMQVGGANRQYFSQWTINYILLLCAVKIKD